MRELSDQIPPPVKGPKRIRPKRAKPDPGIPVSVFVLVIMVALILAGEWKVALWGFIILAWSAA